MVILDPLHILRTPSNGNYQPDNALCKRIALYFHQLTGLCQDQIKRMLPEVMPTWGRVHISKGGDNICSAMASSKYREECDASYIRVCSSYIV